MHSYFDRRRSFGRLLVSLVVWQCAGALHAQAPQEPSRYVTPSSGLPLPAVNPRLAPPSAQPRATLPPQPATLNPGNDIQPNRAPASPSANTVGEPARLSPEAPATPVAPATGLAALESSQRKSIAKVTPGNGSLPNAQGQVWREYDLTPFTQRNPDVARPEGVVVDWILRETGYEAWHGDVLSILSADSQTLRVYHTPGMQTLVNEIVDRFVNPETVDESFAVRMISVDSPAWRSRAAAILKPIPANTPGVQAWVVAKEDAAILVGELRKRTDYKEHGNPRLSAIQGRTLKTQSLRARNFVQGYQAGLEVYRGPLPLYSKLNEGCSLEFTPLVAVDGKSVDAMIRCDIDQIEKVHSVATEVAGVPQNYEIPQQSAHRVHERFRWPTDKILIVGLGMVPTPTPTDGAAPLLSALVSTAPPRVDLLLFVEPRGKSQTAAITRPQPSNR